MRDDISEILSKAPRQASVSTTGKMREAIEAALEVFPDAETAGDAIRRAVIHWLQNRESNSKRGQLQAIRNDTLMILGRLARLEEEIAEIKEWLKGHGFE